MPEAKRRAIGDTFIAVFEREGADPIAQATTWIASQLFFQESGDIAAAPNAAAVGM